METVSGVLKGSDVFGHRIEFTTKKGMDLTSKLGGTLSLLAYIFAFVYMVIKA